MKKQTETRAAIKAQLLKELEREDWRPTFIRSKVRGLKNLEPPSVPDNPEIREALFFSARLNKTTISRMLGGDRIRENVSARYLCFHYLGEIGLKPEEIALIFGMDRTNIYHGWEKITNEIEAGYKPTVKMVNKYKELLNEPGEKN